MTAREFNQSVARAQRVAEDQPVMITKRGEPAYVLLSIEEYTRLAPNRPRSILEFLAMPADDLAGDDGEFDRIIDQIVADRKNDFGRPPIEF
ncbi:type II toxin-antitoxin system prevent-host-death family antitoxin [Microbacterium sp. WCS2018Hpa-23]|uniref:type II toxin-antitoxin system prevent-host-death family antitoxin n=1 Tax=Microbacterium sp. WCS2018Hpa-23 TaxID=3073634 RepID=UPI00288356F0|nr:type II toxin-antitoxin system prevent-host-death family antitoxin [Microbacterium sp. WCS2018Hpa-23]